MPRDFSSFGIRSETNNFYSPFVYREFQFKPSIHSLGRWFATFQCQVQIWKSREAVSGQSVDNAQHDISPASSKFTFPTRFRTRYEFNEWLQGSQIGCSVTDQFGKSQAESWQNIFNLNSHRGSALFIMTSPLVLRNKNSFWHRARWWRKRYVTGNRATFHDVSLDNFTQRVNISKSSSALRKFPYRNRT